MSAYAKKVHCKTVLTASGAFCGIRGKELQFTRPGHREEITCKLCLMYFPSRSKRS